MLHGDGMFNYSLPEKKLYGKQSILVFVLIKSAKTRCRDSFRKYVDAHATPNYDERCSKRLIILMHSRMTLLSDPMTCSNLAIMFKICRPYSNRQGLEKFSLPNHRCLCTFQQGSLHAHWIISPSAHRMEW